MIRRLMVLALVVVALAAVAGTAAAESGGVIPPIRMMSWGAGR